MNATKRSKLITLAGGAATCAGVVLTFGGMRLAENAGRASIGHKTAVVLGVVLFVGGLIAFIGSKTVRWWKDDSQL